MKTIFVILAGILFAGMALASEEHGNHEMEPTNTQQTLCPVMEGNPVDPDIYVDYQGERVYFCCNFCVDEFQKSPEKYISKLPQFTAADEHAHEAGGFKIYRLTKPLGIATFALLILTPVRRDLPPQAKAALPSNSSDTGGSNRRYSKHSTC